MCRFTLPHLAPVSLPRYSCGRPRARFTARDSGPSAARTDTSDHWPRRLPDQPIALHRSNRLSSTPVAA